MPFWIVVGQQNSTSGLRRKKLVQSGKELSNAGVIVESSRPSNKTSNTLFGTARGRFWLSQLAALCARRFARGSRAPGANASGMCTAAECTDVVFPTPDGPKKKKEPPILDFRTITGSYSAS